MKFVFLISLLSVLVATATAYVLENVQLIHKDHRGKCVIPGEVILSPGEETQSIALCSKIICKRFGFVDFHFCDKQIPNYNYKLGAFINPNADYPKCCLREEEYIIGG